MNGTWKSRTSRPDRSSEHTGTALAQDALEARSRPATLVSHRAQPESAADLPADRFIPGL
jgi:hypothetical protein